MPHSTAEHEVLPFAGSAAWQKWLKSGRDKSTGQVLSCMSSLLGESIGDNSNLQLKYFIEYFLQEMFGLRYVSELLTAPPEEPGTALKLIWRKSRADECQAAAPFCRKFSTFFPFLSIWFFRRASRVNASSTLNKYWLQSSGRGRYDG